MPTGGFDINDLKRRMQGATPALKHELGWLAHRPRRAPRCSSRCRSTPTAPNAAQPARDHQRARTAAALGPGLGQVDGKAVEKAIVDSNLGLTPATEGQVLRLRIPELNEERRKELVKVAHKYAEAAKVAVRHVRRDGLDIVKKLEKNHEISEDDQERLANDVQKATDGMISEIDQLLAAKEKEILYRLTR